MFPPFPEEEALQACQYIIKCIREGSVELRQIAPVSIERSDHGVMLGVLIAEAPDKNRVVLQTVSGISKALVPAADFPGASSIYVEPVVPSARIEAALAGNDEHIHTLTTRINILKKQRRLQGGTIPEPGEEERALSAQRTALTTQSLNNVFALYAFHCADGTVHPLSDICRERGCTKLPPTGTGDCCAPKLLDYAFAHHLVPKSMCEVFYGKTSAHKIAGTSYPPCDERCGIILPSMLGLEILYRDSDIIVVNKQSGVLSVPGRGPEKQDCIVNRVRRLFPDCIEQPSVHRLDMETSGLLVLAFTEDAHRNLCRQFENGEVQKRYTALIDGNMIQKGITAHGQMELYFRLDIDNRPHQIWDTVYGKKAVTEWNIMGTEKYTSPDGKRRTVTRVSFLPHTGRTHQLRLASSDIHGFGIPIVGDTLYGTCQQGERLMLHAEYIHFTHPVTGQVMEFTCRSSF